MLRALDRTAATAMAAAFAALSMWLLMADRGIVLGNRIVDELTALYSSFERALHIDILRRDDMPFAYDTIGHAILWAVGTVLAGWLLAGRVRLRYVVAGVAVVSLLSEIAQPLVSTHRGTEATDALGNLVGVGIGAMFLMACAGSLQLVRWAVRAVRPESPPTALEAVDPD